MGKENMPGCFSSVRWGSDTGFPYLVCVKRKKGIDPVWEEPGHTPRFPR